MVEFPDLAATFNKALEEALRDLGKVNVLIAGRTGVGKSTLINSVFQGRLAATGQGEPVTQTTRLLSKEGIPLAIWDTRGLEMSDFQETLGELKRLIDKRLQAGDVHAPCRRYHGYGRGPLGCAASVSHPHTVACWARASSSNSRTASFLNSPVNFLRRRSPMDASRRIVVPRLVSTKPGQGHSVRISATLLVERSRWDRL